MRTKDELFLLGDIGIMLQYLYISENHRITFNNGITDFLVKFYISNYWIKQKLI